MADYASKSETKTTRVTTFTLSLPSNLVEVTKMSAGAQAKWREQHPSAALYDDSIEVVADEQTLTFRWEDEVSA